MQSPAALKYTDLGGGGFKPLPGEMIHLDEYYSIGLKPPTSHTFHLYDILCKISMLFNYIYVFFFGWDPSCSCNSSSLGSPVRVSVVESTKLNAFGLIYFLDPKCASSILDLFFSVTFLRSVPR